MRPELAAVVPTLGRGSLVAALESLRQQGSPIAVTVVHQGSEPLPAAARGLCARVLVHPQPLGFAAAVEDGLRDERAPYVVLLNDDAVLAPGWLENVLPVIASDPSVAAAQGANLDEQGLLDSAGLGWNHWWQAVQLGAGGRIADSRPREVFGVTAAAAIFRTGALRATALGRNVFEPRLDTYYEDVELAGRLRSYGYRAAVVPAARAQHLGGGSAGALGGRRLPLLYGNRLLVLARLLGGQLGREAPRARLRDLLDAARRPSTVPAIAAGWRRARRLGAAFVRDSPPLLPRREQLRLAAEGFAP